MTKEQIFKSCFPEYCAGERCLSPYFDLFQIGFEEGEKQNEELQEAMMKLKDEGIVKPLKDSILRNERLSSQEQQELCAWIECAMDFGEKL